MVVPVAIPETVTVLDVFAVDNSEFVLGAKLNASGIISIAGAKKER